MLTNKQRYFYFGLWKKAKAILMHGRETWTGHEENLRRREITVRALGYDKSSTDFTNREFDKVVQELRAIIDPGDLNGQLRQLNMERTRIWRGLRSLMRQLDVTDSYVQAIASRMFDSNSQLSTLNSQQLRDLMIALREHQRRASRTYILHPA